MRILRPIRVAALLAGLAVALSAGVIAAPPAQAAGHAEGFVRADQPTAASYSPDPDYSYNSSGGRIELTRSGVGDYTVRFEGLASKGGVAQVSAYRDGGGHCALASYGSVGGDQLLQVRCFSGLGKPADTPFLANFTDQRAAGGYFAYVRSDDPDPAGGSYRPRSPWAYDSTGVPVTVSRTGVGQYQVHLGSIEATMPQEYLNGFFQASALAAAAVRCRVGDVSPATPRHAPVICHDHRGSLVDSGFTLTYANGVNVLGSATRHANVMVETDRRGEPTVVGWSSPGDRPTVVRRGVGGYLVGFPGLTAPEGHAGVHAFGYSWSCRLVEWVIIDGMLHGVIECEDDGVIVPPGGAPAERPVFNVAFTG